MSAETHSATLPWRQANDAYCECERRRIRLLLDGDQASELAEVKRECDAQLAAMREAGTPAPLELLVRGFGLSAFERDVMLLCLAPELAADWNRLFAQAQDDTALRFPTPQLAMALFPEADWHSFQAHAPLRRFSLVSVGESAGLATAALRLPERVASYLLGFNELDEKVDAVCRAVQPARLTARQEQAAGRLAGWMGERLAQGAVPRLNLVGPVGKAAVARETCERAGLDLMRLDLARLTADDAELTRLIERESTLLRFAVYIEEPGGGAEARAIVEDLLGRLRSTILLGTNEPWPSDWPLLSVDVEKPSQEEQAALWHEALGEEAPTMTAEIEDIVQRFDFGPEAIARAAEVARGQARLRGSEETMASDLRRSCRDGSSGSLEGLARPITPCFGWDDIVLQDDLKRQLREIADQVAHRHEVYVSWGFGRKLSRGRGITALFSGPSGTGKTMAAEVLAATLDLDLYRIDLSSVVSKWIGETEKNLGRLFDAAERGGAVLFFDEADALFGKRTEVSDSHARYANIEIDYLLQRMEEYRGLAVLATNMKSQLDQAFLRRLRFVIDFPFPDFEQRQRIWEKSFPPEAPLGEVSYDQLARLQVSGGNIRNIAVNAAFLAAGEGSPINMDHLMRTAAREYVKEERLATQDEFGEWYGRVCG